MKHNYIILSAVAVVMASCSDESVRIAPSVGESELEIRLQAEIDQLNPTRADDSGFTDGDVIGVYAVNFENGQPGNLSVKGNNADNVAYKFDETVNVWNGDKSIFFKDDKTPVDIIGYYPYSREIESVEAYPISVAYNQAGESRENKMSAYEASDFLWAKSVGVTPSAPSTMLRFKHILSSVRVSLTEGKGFSEGEWVALDKTVLVCNTVRDGKVNLSTGEVTITENKDNRDIATNKVNNDYRAVVIPQDVAAGKPLLSITVGGKSYKFIKEVKMTYVPSKQHNFTIEVDKNESTGDYVFQLLDESITAWESDILSHNGISKEYLVVNLEEGGSLESKIKELALDADGIINLKLTGKMLNTDFEYIRTSMINLEAINLHEIDLSECGDYSNPNYCIPEGAFLQMQTLKTCVLPAKVKIIGSMAFYGTSLTGSLNIPEGVEEIGGLAFSNYCDENAGASWIPGGQILSHNNLTGNLILPSTLKKIGYDAFRGCDFTGSLSIPESVEIIENAAFADCKHFTGDIHFPEGIKELGEEALSGMTGISGWVILPPNLTEIKSQSFYNTSIAGIVWPKKLKTIGWAAFRCAKIKQDITIPESVIKIESACFSKSNIRHITFSPNLTTIPDDCFADCSELSDTITIPDMVEVIGGGAFYGCRQISALILPAALQHIENNAFGDCYNISYIRCDAVEPPSIDENTFSGVEKDNFTLEVPEQSVEAYRNAPGWCEFKRIAAYRNFVARPSKYNVLNKGGKKEIVLNADGDWEVTDCPSWCHLDKSSGSKKTVVTLKVDEMAKKSVSRKGTVTFRLKGKDNYLTHIDVGQYDYEYDENEYLTLQSSAKGKGINIVLLGDGYDAVDIANGTYLKDMNQGMEYFFGLEPYTTYRDYFNVYTAFALSEDSGVESINAWRTTKFNVCIGNGCSLDMKSADWKKALDYCAEYVSPTVKGANPQVGCILISNTDTYQGWTYSMGDSFCAVVTKSSENYPYDARGLIQHEAGGHGIGWLGDEYIYHAEHIRRCGCSCCEHELELNEKHAVGFALNLSTNGKYKEVEWSHLIFHPSYGDIVDIYEGGFFHSRGVYRSESNSCMNNNIPYFSTWSRQLIVQRIMKLAGEKFNLEDFYAKDSRAIGGSYKGTRGGEMSYGSISSVRRGNSPILITGYKYGKKGGKR